MKKSIIVFVMLIPVALISFAAGYYGFHQSEDGSSLTENVERKSPSEQNNKTGFQQGWDAAKERLQETGYTIDETDIDYVNGEVTKKEGDKIYIEIDPVTPLSDPALDNRIVVINSDTQIFKLLPKDMEQFEREMDEFDKKMEELESSEGEGAEEARKELLRNEPTPDIKESAEFSEINVGDYLHVKADHDIATERDFEATTVEIN